MITVASQITSLTVVYSTVYSDAGQRKHQKLRVTVLCVGNSPGAVNSPHKGPVTRKMLPFDDVIMVCEICSILLSETSRRKIHLGLYSLSRRTRDCEISYSLEAARFDVVMIVWVWNLTGISAVLPPGCMSFVRTIGKVKTRPRGFEASPEK